MNYEILHQDAFPVVKCDLKRGEFIKAESDAMVAMSANLDVSGTMGNGNFFVLRIHGTGTVFLSSYGAIHLINLEAGEEVIIDNGHLVAWHDYN